MKEFIVSKKKTYDILVDNFENVPMADHVRSGADKNDNRILGQLVDILIRKKSTPR